MSSIVPRRDFFIAVIFQTGFSRGSRVVSGSHASDNLLMPPLKTFFKYTSPSRIPYQEKLGHPGSDLSVYFCCSLHSSEGHLLWFLMAVLPLHETSIENSNLWRPGTTPPSAEVSWEFYIPLCLQYFCFLFFNCSFRKILVPSSFSLPPTPPSIRPGTRQLEGKN